MRNTAVLLAATAALLPAAPAVQAQGSIQVVLNGSPLRFANTPPTLINGSTMVPMRDIFEALGASVRYDKPAQTVYGQKGQTNIILPIGQTAASVDGRPVQLNQPAQIIRGTTLVPLRFIGEALGADVKWVPATRTVQIQTVDSHVGSLPAPPEGANGTVSGQVTGVYTNTTPTQITLRVNGKSTVVALSPATILLRSEIGQAASPITIAEISPGDQISVQRAPNGTAQIITDTYGEVRGTIVSIGKLPNGNSAITLDSGKIVELAPGAPISYGGRRVDLSDVKTYEKAVIRTNPSNNMGYGVAVITAANPNPTPPGQLPNPFPNNPANPAPANPLPPGAVSVQVNSFTVDADKPLRGGDTLKATLAGTPGGKASFSIPGVVDTVTMQETSPGVYSGSYTVPRSAAAERAAALGKLVVNGVSSALIQAPGTLTLDSQPPKITDFGPASNATVESQRPLIYGTLSDGSGVGVDPRATHIVLDGKDVSGQADLTGSLFTFKPETGLANGPHAVSVSVADKAGNAASAQWNFTVATGNMVQSFKTNEPAGQSIGAGSTVMLTLNAQPGGKALANIGSLAKDIPLNETSPGVYTGEYAVRPGDAVQNAPVTARFTAKDGTQVTTSLSDNLTVAAGPSAAPRILSPADNDTINTDNTVTIKGKATPGSTVHVAVSYESKVLGGFLPVSGQSASKDVVTDKNGDWTADGLSLKVRSLLGGTRDTVFTVTATELDSSGAPSSDDAKITLRPS